MRKSTLLAIGMILLGGVCLALGATGTWQLVSGIVLGILCVVLSIPFWIWSGIQRGFDRDATRVRELADRGVRLRGKVVDALPYTSEHGGAVFTAGGAQMVLRVEVDRGGRREAVTVHLVDSSEAARALIGQTVTVVEHPQDRHLRALQGYLPNGRRG